jgi:predicted RNase H-like HicB family nuclease
LNTFSFAIEKAKKNFSLYSPELPGCSVTGKTPEETEEKVYEAIEMHLREFIPCNRSALVARSKEAGSTIRNKKRKSGTSSDLLADLSI